MKKTVLTSLATMGLALGAFAQGAISLDNSTANNGVKLNGDSLYYSGTAGVQVWYQNGTTFNLASINGQSPAAAYGALSADGFTLATTFTGATLSAGGFSLGDLLIPGVTPAGSSVTLAIAAWQGSGATFNGANNGGVLAFYQPTRDYVGSPTLSSPDLTAGPGGFNTTDLTLAPVSATPEPGTFALAGLGAAALLIFRRRK